jgi:hypothetical protein
MPCRGNFTFNNGWVVPYNPFLLLTFECHINVEICSSVKSVKYLHKYVYKGHDRAEVALQPVGNAEAGPAPTNAAARERDEIKEYVDGRYVSASEAAWRLYGFEMHDISPNVTRLAVHVEGGQQVYFGAAARAEDVVSDTCIRNPCQCIVLN